MDKIYDDTHVQQTAELIQAKKLLAAFRKKKKDKYRRFIEKKIDIDKDKKWKKYLAHCTPFLAESVQLIINKSYNNQLFIPIDVIRLILDTYGYFEMSYQSMFYFYHMTDILDFYFYYSPIIEYIKTQKDYPYYWVISETKDYYKQKAIEL